MEGGWKPARVPHALDNNDDKWSDQEVAGQGQPQLPGKDVHEGEDVNLGFLREQVASSRHKEEGVKGRRQ